MDKQTTRRYFTSLDQIGNIGRLKYFYQLTSTSDHEALLFLQSLVYNCPIGRRLDPKTAGVIFTHLQVTAGGGCPTCRQNFRTLQERDKRPGLVITLEQKQVANTRQSLIKDGKFTNLEDVQGSLVQIKVFDL